MTTDSERPDRTRVGANKSAGRRDTPRIHPGAPYLTDTHAQLWALASADARGCTCEPTVGIARHGSYTHVQVSHDEWCPVLDRRATT